MYADKFQGTRVHGIVPLGIVVAP